MKTIGLIGGMSWESYLLIIKSLISDLKKKLGGAFDST
jgi:aspartate/glutamate racemase